MQIGERAAALRRIVGVVAPEAGEEEESGGESRLVDPLRDELPLHDGQSHGSVFRREGETVRPLGGKGGQVLAPGDDHPVAPQRPARPLDRAGLDVAAVRGRERDAGAGHRLKTAAAGRGDTQ